MMSMLESSSYVSDEPSMKKISDEATGHPATSGGHQAGAEEDVPRQCKFLSTIDAGLTVCEFGVEVFPLYALRCQPGGDEPFTGARRIGPGSQLLQRGGCLWFGLSS
eukprot:6489253-Amphidinium_carterae.1